jgi:hypothetical protein
VDPAAVPLLGLVRALDGSTSVDKEIHEIRFSPIASVRRQLRKYIRSNSGPSRLSAKALPAVHCSPQVPLLTLPAKAGRQPVTAASAEPARARRAHLIVRLRGGSRTAWLAPSTESAERFAPVDGRVATAFFHIVSTGAPALAVQVGRLRRGPRHRPGRVEGAAARERAGDWPTPSYPQRFQPSPRDLPGLVTVNPQLIHNPTPPASGRCPLHRGSQPPDHRPKLIHRLGAEE